MQGGCSMKCLCVENLLTVRVTLIRSHSVLFEFILNRKYTKAINGLGDKADQQGYLPQQDRGDAIQSIHSILIIRSMLLCWMIVEINNCSIKMQRSLRRSAPGDGEGAEQEKLFVMFPFYF
jgi:hypothetical protein